MEGPSLVILKEEIKSFKGRKIIEVSGNTKIEKERFKNKTVRDFKSWGKHFLICFDDFFVRIHFLMFGSYRVNEKKEERSPRLSLVFKNGEINFYTCSVKINEADPGEVYDWDVDVMSDEWNAKKALASLKKMKETMVCDALLDQDIFAGVGNIIKNEVLFRIRVHPETLIGALKSKQLKNLVEEARNYSFDFYEWKKIYQLRKHWLIYKKRKCPRCEISVITKHTGKGKRYSFFCEICQKPS
ncbi:MAG TPA: DNA-formamidopyrimidine glycosylase family protein [Chitinophagaceae bacterium]|nr:DNA-formamidopyrimidine glycosylase family protein [Chitinophagaceae bacterium]